MVRGKRKNTKVGRKVTNCNHQPMRLLYLIVNHMVHKAFIFSNNLIVDMRNVDNTVVLN